MAALYWAAFNADLRVPACGGLPQNEELPALCAAPCGVYGVLSVLCFFLFQKYRGIDAIAFSALTYGRYLYDGNFTQLYAIATSIPILLYNGKRGAVSLKYFFYIIYPAHLLVLYAIHYILANHLLPF